MGRIQSWSNLSVLTYGGRAQLIMSDLSSIQMYWSQIFIIPQKVLQGIECKLMAFLWSGSDLNPKCAKVKWSMVCAPKDEGGLGFRKLKECNKAAMLKHLWALSKKADSLWVKWVHTCIIRGQNLWHMVVPSDSSWKIRKIFQLRSLCQPLILYKVGNGWTTFAWLDNWHPLGPLYQRFRERVCSNIGLSLNAKVSSLIRNGTWKWPRGCSRITQEIKDNTPEGFLPVVTEDDSMIWSPSNSGIFTMKSAWAAIRSTTAVQEWCKVVWFSKHVPCWAFILWLAMQSKMNTRDRLLKWSNF